MLSGNRHSFFQHRFEVERNNLFAPGKGFLEPAESGDLFTGYQKLPVGQPDVQQSAYAVTYIDTQYIPSKSSFP